MYKEWYIKKVNKINEKTMKKNSKEYTEKQSFASLSKLDSVLIQEKFNEFSAGDLKEFEERINDSKLLISQGKSMLNMIQKNIKKTK